MIYRCWKYVIDLKKKNRVAHANVMQSKEYKALSRTTGCKYNLQNIARDVTTKTRPSVGRRKYLRCCATPEAILMHPAALTYALTQVFEVYR